jgi:hypothetical protein
MLASSHKFNTPLVPHVMKQEPNAQYNLAPPDSLPQRLTLAMRRRMYARFVSSVRPQADESVLDVGVTSDRTYEFSNYFVAWYPHKSRITAAGIDDATFLEEQFPGVRFVHADGRALPFEDRSFDLVHSSAVIEHVGDRAAQRRFVHELFRVARRAVCLTTPNRWFPVEVHTSVPLLHWLPAPMYRRLLRLIGLHFFADEDNLNLLGTRDLLSLCSDLGLRSVELHRMRLLGITSNLLLVLRKDPDAPASTMRSS